MSEKTLKYDNVEVNKKEFHASKQAIDLNLVDTDKIVISDKFNPHMHEISLQLYCMKWVPGDSQKEILN